MDYQLITVKTQDRVVVVTMNVPEKLNGTSAPMQAEIRHALACAEQDPQIRALVLTGAGRAFCAGADLDAIRAQGDAQAQAEATYRGMQEFSNPLILALQETRLPVVAALNGIAAGAGARLALARDIVVAARSASFLLPFAPRLGLVPDLGGSWLMPQLVGRARALGACLLGDRISAEQALQWGMIWQLVEDEQLQEAALALATRLAATPRHAALELRRAFDRASQQSLAEQLDYEAQRQRQLLATDEFQEGLAAFMERRAPEFA